MQESAVAPGITLHWVRRAVTDDTFVIGRALLCSLVAELTNARVDEVRITASCPDCGGPHGKPMVEWAPAHPGEAPGPRPVVHVGLAHSARITVAVASFASAIGVDIEDLPGTADARAAIGALTGESSLRHWTRVEAVLKADGRGLRVDPGEVVLGAVLGDPVVGEAGQPGPSPQVEAGIRGSDARFALSEPFLDESVVVSVALRLN